MTTGELDFDGIFFNSQEDADDGNNLFYPHVAYFLWIVFIVMMPILLSNLLVSCYSHFVLKTFLKQSNYKHQNLEYT